jgi:hypothetical protein
MFANENKAVVIHIITVLFVPHWQVEMPGTGYFFYFSVI